MAEYLWYNSCHPRATWVRVTNVVKYLQTVPTEPRHTYEFSRVTVWPFPYKRHSSGVWGHTTIRYITTGRHDDFYWSMPIKIQSGERQIPKQLQGVCPKRILTFGEKKQKGPKKTFRRSCVQENIKYTFRWQPLGACIDDLYLRKYVPRKCVDDQRGCVKNIKMVPVPGKCVKGVCQKGFLTTFTVFRCTGNASTTGGSVCVLTTFT